MNYSYENENNFELWFSPFCQIAARKFSCGQQSMHQGMTRLISNWYIAYVHLSSMFILF